MCHAAGKPVLVYFGNRSRPTNDIDIEQLAALRSFKIFCQDKSFYGEFTDAHDLAQKVKRDLLREMRNMRFPREVESVRLPASYLLEGDQLTLRTQFEYSDHFANQPDGESAILENALVLLYSGTLSTLREVVRVLETVARVQEPLLIIAREVEGEALASLALNRVRGTLACCPVNFRGAVHDRKALLAIKKFMGATILGDPEGRAR